MRRAQSHWPQLLAALAGIVIFSPSSSFAGKVFLTPTPIASTIAASHNTAYTPDGRLSTDMVNGFGFNGTNFTFPGPTFSGLGAGTVTDPSTGYTIPAHNIGGTSYQNSWLSDQNGTNGFPILTFDLGQVFNLDRMWVWNSAEQGNRQSDTMDVWISQTGTPGSYTLLADNLPLATLDAQGDSITNFSFNHADARFVQFTDIQNDTLPGGSDPYTGLAEVVFFQSQFIITLAPEPSSFVLAGVMGVLGGGWYVWKRRRRQSV